MLFWKILIVVTNTLNICQAITKCVEVKRIDNSVCLFQYRFRNGNVFPCRYGRLQKIKEQLTELHCPISIICQRIKSFYFFTRQFQVPLFHSIQVPLLRFRSILVTDKRDWWLTSALLRAIGNNKPNKDITWKSSKGTEQQQHRRLRTVIIRKTIGELKAGSLILILDFFRNSCK